MVVSELLVVDTERFEFFLGGLAPRLNPEESLLFQIDPVFIFVTGKAPAVNVEVLILVLPLIFALEALQILHVLFLQPQFEVLELSDLLLIVVDGLGHAVFFALDHH